MFSEKEMYLAIKICICYKASGKEMWRNPCGKRTNPLTVMAYSQRIFLFFIYSGKASIS